MSDNTWSSVVAPLVARCEVAAKFGHSAVWNAEGAAALGELLAEMARIIDEEIVRREQRKPPCGYWYGLACNCEQTPHRK